MSSQSVKVIGQPLPDPSERPLSARLEPFDSYWQAPDDVEKGYTTFAAYYRANYLPRMPQDKEARILVISCGPGYLVDVLNKAGYRNVAGIDADAAKVDYARRRGLQCDVGWSFSYLARRPEQFDVIIPEQELNHLTIEETIEFLKLCHAALKPGGRVVLYAINSANPLVGSENRAQNIDHFYTVTEYSINQLLTLGGFVNNTPFPLKLYVFWRNPLNYAGLAVTLVLELIFRIIFKIYGKKVDILSKKIGAVGFRQAPGDEARG